MQSLLRTKPANLDDLTVQVALVRPGPIQGKAVHPYIDAREKLRDDPAYVWPVDHELLREPLRSTFGVVVFQDQVLEVAIALAGFTVGEAEGPAAGHEPEAEPGSARGVPAAVRHRRGGEGRRPPMSRIRSSTSSSASPGFGFPKAHAAAFGLLAYQSQWLRRHHPAEFLCSLLNAQPMGFYPPATLVRDAQRRGVEVLPPDVNVSAARCTIEDRGQVLQSDICRNARPDPGFAVRVGISYVSSVGSDDAEALVAERDEDGLFRDIGDLARRVPALARRARRVSKAARATASAGSGATSSGSSGSCCGRSRCPGRTARRSSSRSRSIPRPRRPSSAT